MAHLLPPAGITYPESERFRNYLVRPPPSQERKNRVVICCERTDPQPGSCCRGDVRCRVIDGDKSNPIKVCNDFSDQVSGFCQVNDCSPRPPLTQPGLLCYTQCVDSRPKRTPCPCRSVTRCTPCEKSCEATYVNPCPTPCPNPWRRPPTQRVCSATCGNRPRLVKETVTSHVYTYQY